MVNRDALRPHALDGSLLWFRPRNGDSLRVDSPATRQLRRRAPRAVMFGLSHACNLSCSFCSRDVTIAQRWNERDAVDLLGALARAGTLEVAFGGGEPLAHAGFVPLLRRLHHETPLALHLTTNGTLLDEAVARELAPLLGEVRVSVYDDTDWRHSVCLLRDARARVAANVIVTPETVDALPGLLTELAGLGCDNAALLRYVGSHRSQHLAGSEWLRLEHAVHTAPLPVRLSRCFADRMAAVPRLFGAGSDCGAGRDFVTIHPDRTVSACSFHGKRLRFRDAAHLLQLYREQRSDDAADRPGCARPLPAATRPSDGLRRYREFASNNSGDTVLVARFERSGVADDLVRALDELSWPEMRDEWQRFLEENGCDPALQPDEAEVVAVGEALLATGYDADDALPTLRAVLTQRGARVVLSHIHSHDSPAVLIGTPARASIAAELRDMDASEVQQHGDTVFAAFGTRGAERRHWRAHLANARLAVADAPLSAELLVADESERLVDACSRLGDGGEPGYFEAWFYDAESATAFAQSLEGSAEGVARAGGTVLVSTRRFRPRLAQRAQRAGGVGVWLPNGEIVVRAAYFRRDYREPAVRAETVGEALQHMAGRAHAFELGEQYRSATARLTTNDPFRALAELSRVATELDVDVHVSVAPTRPSAHALGRIRRELTVLKERR